VIWRGVPTKPALSPRRGRVKAAHHRSARHKTGNYEAVWAEPNGGKPIIFEESPGRFLRTTETKWHSHLFTVAAHRIAIRYSHSFKPLKADTRLFREPPNAEGNRQPDHDHVHNQP
jgi:hypothetical protein